MAAFLQEWPTPFLSRQEVGESLPFPERGPSKRSSAWLVHPAVEMPIAAYKPDAAYDAPTYDMAAMHYAVHPDFDPSSSERACILENGRWRDEVRTGRRQNWSDPALDNAKKAETIAEILSPWRASAPVTRRRRFRPTMRARALVMKVFSRRRASSTGEAAITASEVSLHKQGGTAR